jgi:hypothetical protein
VARRNPATLNELHEIRELRRWQIAELGDDFLAVLAPHRKSERRAPTEVQR